MKATQHLKSTTVLTQGACGAGYPWPSGILLTADIAQVTCTACKTKEVCHASNRRGITECGDATPGRLQTNTEKYPENWSQVTCTACKEKQSK